MVNIRIDKQRNGRERDGERERERERERENESERRALKGGNEQNKD